MRGLWLGFGSGGFSRRSRFGSGCVLGARGGSGAGSRGAASIAFFDEGRAFAEAFAEVSEFGAPDIAFAFDLDFFDARGVEGKDALDAFAVADAADGGGPV